MLISYNWLQRYFDTKLPSPEELADKLIFHSFEVEGTETKDGDTVLDIKVLPDRAHDCLSHYGIAKEISALFSLELSAPQNKLGAEKEEKITEKTNRELKIIIEEEFLCRRYIGRMVENIKVAESPDWLKEALNSVGQRSINNIVDVANYLMLDIGQPIHAFDADHVEGSIIVRYAKEGEKITTLEGKDFVLENKILIISDDKDPLGIAGVKGGKKAETTMETTNLILEAASFNPVELRKSSQKVGIKTDASKRFENELSTEIADYAMDYLTAMIVDVAGTAETRVGPKVDVYPTKVIPPEIEFETKEFSERLGVEIALEESVKILESLGIKVAVNNDKIKVTPPVERLDLQARENYVEEVGRIYGYEKIAGKVPGNLEARPLSEAEKRFGVANKIRTILKAEGFTEVYGYAFTDQGEVELANPLASDKKFLRTNLTDWLTEKIKVNLPYILFDDEAVKIFEIGKVFVGGNEETRLGLGVGYRKKIKGKNSQEEIKNVCEKIGASRSLVLGNDKSDEVLAVQEFDFDKLVEETKNIEQVKLEDLVNSNASYKTVSPYPRIIRDVAVWVPTDIAIEQVSDLIKNSAGELCVEGPILFDEFSKEGRKSLAFRLVFQSYARTLSDDEANAQMEAVIKALEAQTGFEVRK